MDRVRLFSTLAAAGVAVPVAIYGVRSSHVTRQSVVTVTPAIAHDVSRPLVASDDTPPPVEASLVEQADADRERRVMAVEPNEQKRAGTTYPLVTTPPGSADVEQTTFGAKPPATLVASFDGLGVGFTGPQGTASLRNPSDNTLAVGSNHVRRDGAGGGRGGPGEYDAVGGLEDRRVPHAGMPAEHRTVQVIGCRLQVTRTGNRLLVLVISDMNPREASLSKSEHPEGSDYL